MRYKRLTEWTENGASLILDNPQTVEEARTQVMEKFKLACNKLAELEDKIEQGKFKEIPEGSVVLTREEYERFQRIGNTIKRFSTISPTEAETENKALKETIGIVLAQKRNIWKLYNQLKEEYAKTRKETAEKIADWLDNEKGYCGLGYLVKQKFCTEEKEK